MENADKGLNGMSLPNLPTLERQVYATTTEYKSPQGEIEEELTRIWAETLRLDKIGRNNSYFELGGDSLLATTIVHKIQDVFGVELPLRDIFELQTIKAIAEKIDAVYNEAIGDMTDEGII